MCDCNGGGDAASQGPLTSIRCLVLFGIEMAAAALQLETCLKGATTQVERDACWASFEAYVFARLAALILCMKNELSNPLP
jgi:hypothetical protein